MPRASSRSSAMAARTCSTPSATRRRTFTASLGELQRHDGFHQPLLRSVVKVAYDLAALLVGGLHDPRSRCK